jgi:DNA-binding NarL/FixJ family response regulator
MRLVEDREARRGYLLKDRVSEVETLLDAIRRVAHGGTVVDPAIVEELVPRTGGAGPLARLSAREREVLALVAEGFSDVTIAERLGLGPDDVERAVEQVFLKLGLRDEHASDRRVAAVLAYLRDAGALGRGAP